MAFDAHRQVWVWQYEDEEGTRHNLDITRGGVRFIFWKGNGG
jgi:hypothetical protein